MQKIVNRTKESSPYLYKGQVEVEMKGKVDTRSRNAKLNGMPKYWIHAGVGISAAATEIVNRRRDKKNSTETEQTILFIPWALPWRIADTMASVMHKNRIKLSNREKALAAKRNFENVDRACR